MKNNRLLNPWTTNSPFRYIKSNEFDGHNIYGYAKKQIYKRNIEPNIDTTAAYFTLVKVLKSTTTVVHWLFMMHNKYYVIRQSRLHKYGECCSIFEADGRGRYDSENPLVIYLYYMDMESALHRFTQEYIALQINNNNPEFIQYL